LPAALVCACASVICNLPSLIGGTLSDVLVDKLLESKADAHARDLSGRIAVANARLAYQGMKRIYSPRSAGKPSAPMAYAASVSYGPAPARKTRIIPI
jgi:hypothetical protein